MDLETLWRLVVSLMSTAALFYLIRRYIKNGKSYNTKTVDLWYALAAWCTAGAVGPLTRAIWDTSGPGLVFTTAAALVTLKGVARKGEWGGRA